MNWSVVIPFDDETVPLESMVDCHTWKTILNTLAKPNDPSVSVSVNVDVDGNGTRRMRCSERSQPSSFKTTRGNGGLWNRIVRDQSVRKEVYEWNRINVFAVDHTTFRQNTW